MAGRGKLLAIGALGVAAGVLAGGGLAGFGAGSGPDTTPLATAPFVPERKQPEPFASGLAAKGRYPVALVRRSTLLYDRPDGKPKVRIPGRTRWRSPRWLGVVRQRGEWLAVTVPELRNARVGWIRADRAAELRTVRWALRADLSNRRLEVERDGKVVRSLPVAIGRPGHTTPVGRYAVTDRLRVQDPGSPYGCCVLALSGHQTRLPAGWPGGDRLAVHATPNLETVGRAVSLGCMRAYPKDAAWLVRKIPIGTPVFVRR
jgi:hypothetical protein